MRTLATLGPAALVTLTGCAQLTSLNWPVNVEGKAASLDAKQRVVFSQQRKDVSDGKGGTHDVLVICAEPSPDALSAFGASLGGSIIGGGSTKAQFASALAEQSASIGLRTQSIQLMRDAMYRACEGYMGGGLTANQFHSLQRRFQNLTLGLLAIEQLTGAVKAEQAVLSTNSGASTGANTEAETEALGNARKARDTAKGELEDAQTQFKKDNDTLVDANKKAADQKAALAAKKEPTQADKDAVAAAEGLAKTAAETVANQKQVVVNKERALATADEMLKIAQENLTAARLQVRAFASGSAAFGSSGAARAQVTEKVADAVGKIVQQVFDESGKGEGCNGIADDFRNRTDFYLQSPALMSLLSICLNEKAADVAARAKKGGVDAPPTYVVPSFVPKFSPAPAPPPKPAAPE